MLCGALISAGTIAASIYGQGTGLDFSVLWRTAQLDQPYDGDPFAPFAYPPTALIWLRPLALLPMWSAFALWSVASVAAYVAVTRRAVLLLSPAVALCIVCGQTSLLLGATALFAAQKKGFVRGAIIGVVLTVKPQMLALAPLVFLARRDWSGLAGMTAGSAVSVAVSLLLFDPHLWLDWIAALPRFQQVIVDRNLWWVTVTPYGAAMRFGLNPYLVWLPAIALALVVAVRSRADPIFVSALASLLAVPYAATHDLVLLLPMVIGEMDAFGALIFCGALAQIGLVGTALRHNHREADRTPENIARRHFLLSAGFAGVGRRRRSAL